MAIQLDIQPAIVAYYGGKHYMARDIIHEMATRYVKGGINGIIDVFGGAGNVIFNVPREWKVTRIYNDIDERLYRTMKVMVNAESRNVLLDEIDHTVNSRELFDDCKKFFEGNWQASGDVEVAYNFVMGSLLSFNAGMANYAVGKYFGRVQPVAAYSEKLKKMWNHVSLTYMVENLDFRELIDKYNRPDVFLYLDPPYFKSGKTYKYSFSKQDFKDLHDKLSVFKGCWLMNESEVDFPFIKEVFGEPYFVKEYVSFAVKAETDGEKTKRLEGFWGNYRSD